LHCSAQEGVDSLTVAELQAACQERGMRSVGVTLQRLRTQLEQWLELNKEGVPASMILLSRALYNMPEADTKAISKTLSLLSDKLVSEAELILLEREGVSVNKKKLEVIAQEEILIEEEMREELEAEEAQRAKDAAKALEADGMPAGMCYVLCSACMAV
jgi:LETM1 and EF-hand domain-containing protein 1